MGVGLFFDLILLSQLISLGSLISYGLVDAGIVLMRFQHKTAPKYIPYLILLFIVLALFGGFTIQIGIHWGAIVGIAAVEAGIIVILYLPKQTNVPVNTFKCPLVPLFPLLGTFINFFICGTIPYASWFPFSIFLVIGILFYFLYSIRKSNLNFPALKKSTGTGDSPKDDSDKSDDSLKGEETISQDIRSDGVLNVSDIASVAKTGDKTK